MNTDKWMITGGVRDAAIETSPYLGLERQKTPCLVQQQLLQTILQMSSLGTPEQLPKIAFFFRQVLQISLVTNMSYEL